MFECWTRTFQCTAELVRFAIFYFFYLEPYHVCSQIDTQDGDGSQRQRNVGDDVHKEWGDLGDVTGQSVGDRLLQVVEDQSAFLHTCDDGGKVVVQQDHVGGLFADITSGDTHGDACSKLS